MKGGNNYRGGGHTHNVNEYKSDFATTIPQHSYIPSHIPGKRHPACLARHGSCHKNDR
jgi:hypothetical protein